LSLIRIFSFRFFVRGELSQKVEQAAIKDNDWLVPFLWRSEFRNVLAYYIRKNLLSLTEATGIMREAEFQLQTKEYFVSSESVLQLVKSSKCSAYDCEFVALAQQFNIRLITMDKLILSEFPDVAISLEKFVD
jgi:predicted nucleic acid-binding protein